MSIGSIKSILLVCTGNSCRSAMAEGLLKRRLKELGKSGITVRSAGIRALDGYPPTDETIEVMKGEGVDLSGFKSTGITDELIKAADLILVMAASHKNEVIKRVPDSAAKIFLLREYGRGGAAGKIADPEIPDPIGLSLRGYKVCLGIIKEEIERVAKLL